MKRALVLGGAGFIGVHLAKRLEREGYEVTAVDIKHAIDTTPPNAYNFLRTDLRGDWHFWPWRHQHFDEVYTLAADMGGAEYIFTGNNDADIMHNSARINLNVAEWSLTGKVGKLFFSSSACVYPEHAQGWSEAVPLAESAAYPANPDSAYGWEKLFSERLFDAYRRNYKLDLRVARFHNIFGPYCTYKGGREKAPAAICRKVAQARNRGTIDVFGDGEQTRSFLYIDECLDGVARLVTSEETAPINIGSSELISINNLVAMVADIAGKEIKINHIPGPQGVRGRNSDNTLIEKTLGWKPMKPLREGMEKLYKWIEEQVNDPAQNLAVR